MPISYTPKASTRITPSEDGVIRLLYQVPEDFLQKGHGLTNVLADPWLRLRRNRTNPSLLLLLLKRQTKPQPQKR
ncbi:uncharacterized protein MYCFIDRAFT_210155 [Pseudocercospora fijiensis CIRAD86]|uniref:Uncharacterized protein n=1 Tax=Pseudocercospora fijiensis (strain CIRAD86) TaxID=383855 RepID=N1QCT0_PSEFD|nr:uncharacterized protein MYCFIDRAFT_210155 [Pseudocercospora fijiensis CIRAD86]EME89652.1 hypothetical protein MYCFIDRAFT_210155 [Pseudocercospora fijiensis CIRAD86]